MAPSVLRGLLLGALLSAALWGAQSLVARQAGPRVQRALAARGYSAQWEDLSYRWGSGFRFTSLALEGRGVQVEVSTLRVETPAFQPTSPERVVFESARIEVDLTERSGGQGQAGRRGPSRALPELRFEHVEVKVKRGGEALARLRGRGRWLNGSVAAAASLRVTGRDEVFRFEAGGRATPWVSGQVSLQFTGGRGPLLSFGAPEEAFRVGEARVVGDLLCLLRGGCDDLEIRASRISLRTPPISADLDALTLFRGELTAQGARVLVDERIAPATGGGGGRARPPFARLLRAFDLPAGLPAGLRPQRFRVNRAAVSTPRGELQIRSAELRPGALEVEVEAAGSEAWAELGFDAQGRLESLTADARLDLESLSAQLPVEPLALRRQRPRLGGELRATLGAEPTEQGWRIGGALDWQGEIEHPALASKPLDGLDLGLSGLVEWDPSALRAMGSSLRSAGLALQLDLSVEALDGAPVVSAHLSGPKTDCQVAFDALPKALAGPYAGAVLQGTMEPNVRFWWPTAKTATLDLKIRGLERPCVPKALKATEEAWPPIAATVRGRDDVGWLNGHWIMNVREGATRAVKIGPGLASYVPIAQLPGYVGGAAYLTEEIDFFRGWAINRGLIRRALRLNLEGKRFIYGGSTVTQQLVKNLFLSREKTLARKFREVLIAKRVAAGVSRERVLELYLNCIEFAPNVFGIGPAAKHYFQKDARALSPAEAVFLAMLKPAPYQGAWMKRRGHTPDMPWWGSRTEEIMERLVTHGYLSRAQAEAARPYRLEWDSKGRYQPAER